MKEWNNFSWISLFCEKSDESVNKYDFFHFADPEFDHKMFLE